MGCSQLMQNAQNNIKNKMYFECFWMNDNFQLLNTLRYNLWNLLDCF